MTPLNIALGDLLDYVIDFRGEAPGPWLQDGETISSFTVTLAGPLEQANSTTVADGAVTVWVQTAAAAREGESGSISVQITTSAGRRHTERLKLVVN